MALLKKVIAGTGAILYRIILMFFFVLVVIVVIPKDVVSNLLEALKRKKG